MSVDKVLKKEGIKLISTLKPQKIQSISEKIAKKICLAFPEHNLNQNDIYTELSKVNMYFADFENQNIGAKYYYKNKSMYFNRSYKQKKLSGLSIHESIHFIQEKRKKNNSLERFGLYCVNKLKPSGQALNEAAVQLMTTQITKTKPDFVKYYGLNFYTPSPDYYPIECALLNQITFFLGTYPLFHSTLYSDDVFKTTLITKTNSKTYRYIENTFDLISSYEDDLSKLLLTLYQSENSEISKEVNVKVEKTKSEIAKVVLELQEKIARECFYSELNNVKDYTSMQEVKRKLLNFKKYTFQSENYNFYEVFSGEILGKLEEKKQFIDTYGIKLYEEDNQYLPILYNENYVVNFAKTFMAKAKKLFQQKPEKEFNLNLKK